jgi:hypothetical protein
MYSIIKNLFYSIVNVFYYSNLLRIYSIILFDWKFFLIFYSIQNLLYYAILLKI